MKRDRHEEIIRPAAVRAHQALAAVPSIARVERVEGEWRLAGVERFISLENVEWSGREACRSLIEDNWERLHEAVSALSVAGLAHEGAMVWGVDGQGQMVLVSLEACRRDPAHAWQTNLIELSDFYRGFGLSAMADQVAAAAEVFLTQREAGRDLPAAEREVYRRLDALLGGQPAQFAYICPASGALEQKAASGGLEGMAFRPMGDGTAILLTAEPLADGDLWALDARQVAHLSPDLVLALQPRREQGLDNQAPCL